jgi:two-component system, cell cycle sensor histidine kinase and response regulator CckA
LNQGSTLPGGALIHQGVPIPPAHGLILLAEDDEAVRGLAVRVLQKAGYRVIVARDGEEALEWLDREGARADLYILDAVMPKRSGRAVYDEIIARRPEARVLFASGYNFGTLDAGHLPPQGLDIIWKPFLPSALLDKVTQMLSP